MPIQTYDRTFALEDIEISRAGDGRTVTAYAAVFGQDAEIRDGQGHYIERIDGRAFAKTIAERAPQPGRPGRVSVLYNHGYDTSGKPNMLGSVPIGTPLEIKADTKGLITVTRYNKSAMADAVLEAIRDGQITGQSFRGRVFQQRGDGKVGRLPVIVRTELGLTEYGPTHSPAYEGAGILAIRSTDDLAEMIRSILREEHDGTPAGAAETDHSTAEPVTDESHMRSGRTRARRNASLMRARELGVINGKAPQGN